MLSLSRVANPGHQLDANGTEHVVDTRDEILEGVQPNEDFEGDRAVLVANLLALGVAIGGRNGSIVVFFTLRFAEAL